MTTYVELKTNDNDYMQDEVITIANLMLEDNFRDAYNVIAMIFKYYKSIFEDELELDENKRTFIDKYSLNEYSNSIVKKAITYIKDTVIKQDYKNFINNVITYANKHHAFDYEMTFDYLMTLEKDVYYKENLDYDELLDKMCIDAIYSTIFR